MGKHPALIVARTGFEPVIFALRGRCPKPLDERAEIYFLSTVNSTLLFSSLPESVAFDAVGFVSP